MLAEDGARRGEPRALAIDEQADRLGRLVADLLDLSRLKGGALPVHPELNMAEDLVGAALRQLAGLLKDRTVRSEEHTSELQSQSNLVCRLLLEKKKKTHNIADPVHDKQQPCRHHTNSAANDMH